MRAGAVLVGWLLSRGLLVWLLLGPHAWVTGDVAYFADSLRLVQERGLAHTLEEYPLPAVAVVAAPWLLAVASGAEGAYTWLVVTAACLTDLAYLTMLWRVGRGPAAVVSWLVGVPLLGATALARFDLLPGVLCGAALLLIGTRPRLASACLALGASVKLWPGLAVPAFLASARSRRDVVLGVGVTGLVLAAATAALGGWGRLVSPLGYQADRGLQVESVLATPVVVAGWQDPGRWPIDYAESRAYEVAGPGVEQLLVLSTLMTAAYVAALGFAWWRAWTLRGRLSGTTLVWLVLAAVTGFLVVGKVLSPQYLLWLLPVAAAGLAVSDSGVLRAWTAGLLVAIGLTQVVFPGFYEQLVLAADDRWVPTVALAARNGTLLALLLVAAREVRHGLRADAQRGIALERQPPKPGRTAGRTAR